MLPRSAEYALRIAIELARATGQTVSADRLAEETRVPRPYLQKLLQGLVRAGLVQSHPGPGGGYMLALNPGSITMLNVVNAVAPIERIRKCPLGLPEHTELCPLHAELDRIAANAEAALGSVTLSRVVESTDEVVPLCEVH
jgi:Rrf2 family protein